MARIRSIAVLLPLALAGGLVGCTSSGDEAAEDSSSSTSTTEAAESTTTTVVVSAEEICPSLQEISEFDAQAEQLVAANNPQAGTAGNWPAEQRFFVENTQPVLDAYDRAIATGTDLADELSQMRDLTADTAELAASSTDHTNLVFRLIGRPGIFEAADAGVVLNSYAQSTCGVSTGGFLANGFSTEGSSLGGDPAQPGA